MNETNQAKRERQLLSIGMRDIVLGKVTPQARRARVLMRWQTGRVKAEVLRDLKGGTKA